MKFTRLFTILLLACVLFISGCWDRREIEQIGLVIGIAIDKSKQHHNKIQLTQQLFNTIGGQKEQVLTKYYNLTEEGRNLFEAIRKTSGRTDRSPFYTHLKIVIISESLASEIDLMKLTSLLQRDHEVRRTVQVLFTPGNARDVLQALPEKKEIPTLNIWRMTRNDFKTNEFPRVITLGDLSIRLTNNKSFLAQKVITNHSGAHLKGAAVISGKSRKIVGWLNSQETAGINFILGTNEGSRGGVVTTLDDKTKKEFVYEIHNVKTEIEPKVIGDDISFKVSIKTEGRIGEDWTNESAFEEDFIQRANKMVEKQIKGIVQKSLAKTKDQYKIDVAGFGERVRIAHYQTWKKYKDNWDKKFSKSEVQVDVQVHIREYGGRGSTMPKKK